MYTVVLLSQSARRRFQSWREIFDPFIRDGSIAVCDWNHSPGVRDLSRAVPGLGEAVRGHAEWRLLVVGTGSEGGLGAERTDPENPFDFAPNWRPNPGEESGRSGLHLRESAYPIVRLSHMVLGYPEIGTKSFFADPSYWDTVQGRRIYESDFVQEKRDRGISEEDARREFLELLPLRNDVQTHFRLDEYSEEDQRRYRDLIRHYEAKQKRPAEVLMLALRDPIEPRPGDELRQAWRTEPKALATQFVERNDYHPSCRFVVFDRPPEDHAAYELGELRFWLSILTLATNDVPASAFQASRLYRVDLDFDADNLATTFNAHMTRLTSVREHLIKEIQRPKATTNLDVAKFLDERPVEVSFDHLSGEELAVPTAGYGLASDVPSSEMNRWEDSYQELLSSGEIFNKKPKRVLAKAVEGTRNSAQLQSVPVTPMTDIEREELEEELTQRIQRLSEATTRDILDRAKFERILNHHRATIRGTVMERMRLKTILVTSALVAGVWLAAFIPFIVAAAQDGGVALTESLLVVLGILGALGCIALATLFGMRRTLVSRIQDLNRDMRTYVNDVKQGANAFASFLTDVTTYMYGKAVLDEEKRRAVREREREIQLNADLQTVETVIKREKALVRSVGGQIEIRRITQGSSEFVSWDRAALRESLSLPVGTKQCEFNQSGDFLQAPFDFVRRLVLRDLQIREDPERQILLLEEFGFWPAEVGTDS